MINTIKQPKYTSHYNNRFLMSYNRNKFPFRGIIGIRGFGKSYSMQNMLCNLYHKVKDKEENPLNVDDMFIWSRLTRRALSKLADDFLDPKLAKKHNIIAKTIEKQGYHEVYFNGRLMGYMIALADAPIVKGGAWPWSRFKYFILDEFQRERRERRTFDVVYNLRSMLESVCRFSTRILEGYDFPYVIFMGNTVDEATDLLYAFDFVPLSYGIHILRSKNAIIEYGQASKKFIKLQKLNPLGILNTGDDFTFEERRLKVKDNILPSLNTGERRYIGHLQITEYIRFEVWKISKNRIYVSNGIQTAKFQNKVFTLHKLAANRGTYYSVDFHKLIRRNYEKNKIYFDKRITATIFNNNVV